MLLVLQEVFLKQLHVSYLPILLSSFVSNPKIAVGGEAVTIITSEGGKGFTLATSGVGVATSVLGSVYTVATATIGSQVSSLTSPTSSSSAFVHHAGVQTSLLVALGSVLVSALLGMMMTL